MGVVGKFRKKKKGIFISLLSFLLFCLCLLLVYFEKHESTNSYFFQNKSFHNYSKIENSDVKDDVLDDIFTRNDNYFEKQIYQFKQDESVLKKNKEILDLVKERFSKYVLVSDGVKLFHRNGDSYEVDSIIHGDSYLELDDEYVIVDEYYKILGDDLYVSYNKVKAISEMPLLSGEYKYYKNYVLFNENVNLIDGAKLYIDQDSYYEVMGGSFSIIIKDDDRFGIEYANRLVYVSKDDVSEVVLNDNTSVNVTDSIAVLNYHYTVSSSNENGELDECVQEICITDTMFDKHINYLKENNFYAASVRDLELFIDGKVRLPEHTVVITIDDGWYVSRSIQILEKYQMLGTLFLIGSLSSPDAYQSEYLEIHSHTWDMHKLGQCPSNVGRGGILCLDEDTILEDLKKSRESLNNTTYFCYPFYDYNSRAIRLLKEAGFTMAFAGGERKTEIGENKFRIPRFVIVNYTSMDTFINMVN